MEDIAEHPESITTSGNHCGFFPKYLFTLPGLIRLINVGLGLICLGLWLPGYPNDFTGERISQLTGDTERGYGEGWMREPLSEFTLAAILIALSFSILLLLGLLTIKSAPVDWHRVNKFFHLGMGTFLLIGGICSIFGVWYFNENCCHVSMSWDGVGLSFALSGSEFYYSKHCFCYLTQYLDTGPPENQLVRHRVLYEASKNPDITAFDHRWSFAAHDLEPHLAAIFFIFLNAVFYFLGFFFSKASAAAGK